MQFDERNITRLERAQYGLTSVAQLRELGISERSLRRRIDAERHDRLRRGVMVNPSVPPSFEQHALAEQWAACSVPDNRRLVAHPHYPPGPGR